MTPRVLRRDRVPSARAQGAISLVPSSQSVPVPKNAPTNPARKRPKTPARHSSQTSLPTPQTGRNQAESDEEEEYDTASSSMASEGRQSSAGAADSPEPSQLVQGAQNKGKAAVVRDRSPTDDELRAVRAVNQITVDKRVVYTERWPWRGMDFDYWVNATKEFLDKWRADKLEIEPGFVFCVKELARPVGTVSCYGIKEPAVFAIISDTAIKEIEEEVFRLIQLGKRDIRLLVSWDFRTIEEPRYDPPGNHGEESQTPTGNRRKRAAPREDATRRQRRQVEFDAAVHTATGSFAPQITGKWQCRDKTCGNHGFVCYPLGKVGHLRITGPEITHWNEAIRGGRATVDMPPADVIAICVQRLHRRDGRRPASPTKGSAVSGPTVININAGGAVSGSGDQSEVVRSSPPAFDGGELENMRLYMRWLVSKGHLSEEVGHLAEQAFVRESWGFQQIRMISPSDWVEMGIPRGARIIISSKQKLWIAVMTEQAIRSAIARSESGEDRSSDSDEFTEL